MKSTCSNRMEVLDALGSESDAVLVVLWNGRRLRDQFHAMHIEKRKDGFIIHNACYLTPVTPPETTGNQGETNEPAGNNVQGGYRYGEKGPFGSLSAAVKGYTAGGAGVALALGIKRQ